MLSSARPEAVAAALEWACRLDVQAAKPGNVSCASPGHGMQAEDFLASAEAIVEPLTRPRRKVGERIAEAVEATARRVGLNTNLGIVLLAAPLTQAALTARRGESLERATARVLGELDADDAAHAFRAIVAANPAGLGAAAHLDVREPPRESLLAAMRQAADRDLIALQYTNGFSDVFGFGASRFLSALRELKSEERATVVCFLGWLSRFPDTHIARKHGLDVARAVRREALQREAEWRAAAAAPAADEVLRAWDGSLKARGLNPGNSADLTVASLLAARLRGAVEWQFSERGAVHAPPREGKWMPGAGMP
jgi:triphosphoribosyl-dephospho-CoA synthase